MTTTTGRHGPARTTAPPWPARYEREHGTAPATGRHAAAEPDAVDRDRTERLPVVARGAFPAHTVLPATPRPLPPGPRGRGPHARTTGPRPAPAIPQQRPAPARPVVGSGLGTAVPTAEPRGGLGTAALCLGLIALPFGLVPVTGFVAAGLGVLALVFGIAGWSRTRAGAATNRGVAVTAAVVGLLALLLGVVATVTFFRAPDRLVYDLDALTSPSAVVVVAG